MRFLTLFLVLIFFQKVQAQEVVGLWNVSKVTVGSDNMTPIAKWFRFKSEPFGDRSHVIRPHGYFGHIPQADYFLGLYFLKKYQYQEKCEKSHIVKSL